MVIERIVKIGVSGVSLSSLEHHHRRYKVYGYTATPFREDLETKLKGKFFWLIKPYRCTGAEITQRYNDLLRDINPEYNSAKPRVCSIKDADQVKLRGVYGFEINA